MDMGTVLQQANMSLGTRYHAVREPAAVEVLAIEVLLSCFHNVSQYQ